MTSFGDAYPYSRAEIESVLFVLRGGPATITAETEAWVRSQLPEIAAFHLSHRDGRQPIREGLAELKRFRKNPTSPIHPSLRWSILSRANNVDAAIADWQARITKDSKQGPRHRRWLDAFVIDLGILYHRATSLPLGYSTNMGADSDRIAGPFGRFVDIAVRSLDPKVTDHSLYASIRAAVARSRK